jgi:hypothetical protein
MTEAPFCSSSKNGIILALASPGKFLSQNTILLVPGLLGQALRGDLTMRVLQKKAAEFLRQEDNIKQNLKDGLSLTLFQQKTRLHHQQIEPGEETVYNLFSLL